MVLTQRSFFHYGTTEYTCLINLEKLQKLTTNRIHKKFEDFIYRTIIAEKVPNEFFTREANRCYNLPEYQCNILERPSRYKSIIEKALRNRKENQEQHFVVQKALLEAPETNFVIAEIPVYFSKGERVGHVDLIEIVQGNPSLVVWDFKPQIDMETWGGQVFTYKVMLANMLHISLKEIMGGAFNNVMEKLLVE